MLMHVMMEGKVLITFLMVQVYTLIVLDRVLEIFCAIGNGLTLNEYRNAHEYKYLFAPDRFKKSFDDFTTRMAHKPVLCCSFLYNLALFFCSCKRKELKQRGWKTP